MPKAGGSEFWRALTPIEEVFRPGAGADVYIADAPTDDERCVELGKDHYEKAGIGGDHIDWLYR